MYSRKSNKHALSSIPVGRFSLSQLYTPNPLRKSTSISLFKSQHEDIYNAAMTTPRPANKAAALISSVPAAPEFSAGLLDEVPLGAGLSSSLDSEEVGDGAPVLEALPLEALPVLLLPVPVGEAAPELVGTFVETSTPASLQISASAASASLVSSPHFAWTCFAMSLVEQTALMSAGVSCSLTAPRRQPGLAAEATVAMAANAATKRVLENMFAGCIVRWDWVRVWVRESVEA